MLADTLFLNNEDPRPESVIDRFLALHAQAIVSLELAQTCRQLKHEAQSPFQGGVTSPTHGVVFGSSLSTALAQESATVATSTI